MRMIKMSLLLAATLVTPALVAHARAQSAAQVTSFKNTQASSFIVFGPSVVCPDGSVGTASGFGFISGSDSISHDPGSPKSFGNGGDLSVFDYSDSCGNTVGFGDAFISGGYTPPDKQLDSAAISANTTIQDFDFFHEYLVTVNLVFTAQGPLSTDHGTSVTHDVSGVRVWVIHGSSSNRSAGVTGTITINGAEPEATYSSTTILSNSNGQTIVQKK
jgi:hypothetical protein